MQSNNLHLDALLEALALYTRVYHQPYSVEALKAGLPLTPANKNMELNELSTLFGRAAARGGLNTQLIERPLPQISQLQLPMILLLSDQQVCILDSFSKDRQQAKIILPQGSTDASEQWLSLDDLQQIYLGFAFVLKKQFEYSESHSRTLNLQQKHWFWSSLSYSRHLYRDVILASVLINLFVLATPLFTMNVYDRVIPNHALETLQVFALGVLGVYLLDTFLKFTRTYLLETAAKKSDIIMSSVIYEKVLDLKMACFPKSVGSFASNLKNFDTIRSFLTNATLAGLIDLPFALIFIAVIYSIGGSIALVPVGFMLVILVYALLVRKPLQRHIESTHEAAAKKNATLVESLQNIETLKSLGNMAHAQWAWEQATGEIAQKSLKSRLLSASIGTMTSFFVQLNTVFIVVYGVFLIQDFKLTMGGLIATMILSSRCVAPMGQVASLITSYEDAKSSYKMLDGILAMPAERPQGKSFVERASITGKIEFKDVVFTYPGAETPALNGVSFTIEAGDKVAIIGRIGSGKSTVEKLILKLYQPESGAILIDGIDINQMDPADLRKNIGYVAQDINLLSGTLKENITYRAMHASDEQVIRAAKISGADEFVHKHPLGYDMPIGERGMGLSGGQRQCVGIARAFLLDAPIMLLDEPSTGMDQTSEARLISNLADNLQRKTCLLVTHKMNLLSLVDKVIVLQEGKVYLAGDKQAVVQSLSGGADVAA